jgi:hypothetical protein
MELLAENYDRRVFEIDLFHRPHRERRSNTFVRKVNGSENECCDAGKLPAQVRL